ncbi:MAG: formyltransferase family protein [Bacteroidales bacterium]
MNNLKIILFANWGLGNLALETISKLNNVEILAVFTQYDNYSTDKYFNVVYQKAKELDYKIFNTYNKKSKEISNEAIKLIDDNKNIIGLSLSFDKIFKKDLIERINIINLHPSYLPKYRGPSPILWAILYNENEIGLTLHFVDDGIDSGNIIKQTLCPIDYQLSFDEITDIISYRANIFLLEYLENIQFPIKSIKQGLQEKYYPRLQLNETERKLPLYELKNILLNKIIN